MITPTHKIKRSAQSKSHNLSTKNLEIIKNGIIQITAQSNFDSKHEESETVIIGTHTTMDITQRDNFIQTKGTQ